MGDRERDRAVWEEIFRNADEGWLAAPPSPLMHRAAEFFRVRGSRRILDAGSGFGRWAVFLAGKLGSRVAGLDYAIGGARLASQLSRSKAPVWILAGEITALPFADRSFDGILAALVLDNLDRVRARAAIREVTRAARPGAALFAVFNPLERPGGGGENPTASCHSEDYTRSQIGDLLEEWRIVSERTDENSLRAFEAILRP